MKFINLWYLIIVYGLTSEAVVNSQNQNQASAAFPVCAIHAAVPVKIKYTDYSTNNCLNGKIRINQPFGLYINRNGVLKWETLLTAQDCSANYFHHSKCNIVIVLPHVQTKFTMTVWRNCTWKYIIN